MEKTGRKTPCKCVIGNELDQEKENTEKGWVCPQCLSRNSDYLNFCIICAGFNPIKIPDEVLSNAILLRKEFW